MAKLRILLADDHGVLRDGLALLINAQPDMEVVASARGGREAVQLTEQMHPDIAVLDVSMSDLGGAEAAEQIRTRCPSVRVVALTRHADQGYLRRLLKVGASGYVLKRSAGDTLVGALRTVAEGGGYVDPTMAHGLVTRKADAASAGSTTAGTVELSEREAQVLRLIAWGQSNKEIAARLAISVKTVESYKAVALEKLQLRSRTDILRYALASNWVGQDNQPE
jgi:DNA-binding NarL/FixJ family response regulator